MNHQAPPRHIVHQLMDKVINDQQQTLPTYGGPQRDAISSVVDGVVADICAKVDSLHETLDMIKNRVVESAGKSKQALDDHVSTCVRINDEIVHMRSVISELAEQTRGA